MEYLVGGILCILTAGLGWLGYRQSCLNTQMKKIMSVIADISPALERRVLENGQSRVIIPPKWSDDNLEEMWGE